MNRVVNFDFPTDQPDKAKEFFTDIFGWKFTEWYNEDYWLVETGNKLKRGINGSIIRLGTCSGCLRLIILPLLPRFSLLEVFTSQ